MDGISCDRCGTGLLIDSDVRYEMRLVIQAAYDPMELTAQDLQRDHVTEFEDLLKSMENSSEQELQDQVHFEGRYDLCPQCQRAVLANPLFQPPGSAI